MTIPKSSENIFVPIFCVLKKTRKHLPPWPWKPERRVYILDVIQWRTFLPPNTLICDSTYESILHSFADFNTESLFWAANSLNTQITWNWNGKCLYTAESALGPLDGSESLWDSVINFMLQMAFRVKNNIFLDSTLTMLYFYFNQPYVMVLIFEVFISLLSAIDPEPLLR